MKLLFVANGDMRKKFSPEFFSDFDHIVCVDGGLNSLCDSYGQQRPSFIIGDLDSARRDLVDSHRSASKIILKNNQDESDLMFALRYFLEEWDRRNDIEEIVLTGIVGSRIDHTLCNIIALRRIPPSIRAKTITAAGEEIFLLRGRGEMILENLRGKTISLIPLTKIDRLTCTGLRWSLEEVSLPFGFVNGVSNVADENSVGIRVLEGELLVVVNETI
ncbi:MAG: thiamine diphosphokinase [Rickettsiales bacterium]|jgi:thiamine pyrophosphokinase|nr:thiamine diphosphokinase [Rickettsiales bacterium]